MGDGTTEWWDILIPVSEANDGDEIIAAAQRYLDTPHMETQEERDQVKIGDEVSFQDDRKDYGVVSVPPRPYGVVSGKVEEVRRNPSTDSGCIDLKLAGVDGLYQSVEELFVSIVGNPEREYRLAWQRKEKQAEQRAADRKYRSEIDEVDESGEE